MGRAKMKMELIIKERARQITFQKRKVGLLRKMHEFTTLCDVRACMFILKPNEENSSSQSHLEVWPKKPDELSLIIDLYNAKSRDKGTRVHGLQDFFEDRRRKMEEEIQRERKRHRERNYPTWMEPISFLPETQLREFASRLKNKLDFLSSKVESMKALNHCHHILPTGWIDRSNRELELLNHPSNIVASLNIPIDTLYGDPSNHNYANTEHEHYYVNQSSTIGLLMNDTDHHQHQYLDYQVQLFGISSSYNVHRASFMSEFYLAPAVGGGAGGSAAGSVGGGRGGVGGAGGGGVIQNGVHGHPLPLSLPHGMTLQPLSISSYTQSPPSMTNVQPNSYPIRENDYSHVFDFQ